MGFKKNLIMKEIKNYGVYELKPNELSRSKGGFLLAAMITFFAIETINNPTASTNAFRSGFKAGYNYNQ